MAGTIVDFFGYRAADDSDASLDAVAKNLCPFLHDTCTKTLGRDGSCSGVCAVKQVSSDQRIICCPIRLYADDYEILRIVSRKTFGVDLGLYSAALPSRKLVPRVVLLPCSDTDGEENCGCRKEMALGTILPIGCWLGLTSAASLRSSLQLRFRLLIRLETIELPAQV